MGCTPTPWRPSVRIAAISRWRSGIDWIVAAAARRVFRSWMSETSMLMSGAALEHRGRRVAIYWPRLGRHDRREASGHAGIPAAVVGESAFPGGAAAVVL